MTNYVLYGGVFTRAALVEMVMIEIGLQYEVREVDILNQQHRTPEYLEVNPTGFVPALITPDGSVLYETPAICLHLAEQHHAVDLVPAVNENERGKFLSALFFLTNELEPAMKRYLYPHRFSVRSEDKLDTQKMAVEKVLSVLHVIESGLQISGPYHLGQRYSLADMVLVYWAIYISILDELHSCPAVQRCMQMVMSRPKTKPIFDQVGTIVDDYFNLLSRGKGVL